MRDNEVFSLRYGRVHPLTLQQPLGHCLAFTKPLSEREASGRSPFAGSSSPVTSTYSLRERGSWAPLSCSPLGSQCCWNSQPEDPRRWLSGSFCPMPLCCQSEALQRGPYHQEVIPVLCHPPHRVSSGFLRNKLIGLGSALMSKWLHILQTEFPLPSFSIYNCSLAKFLILSSACQTILIL